MKQTFTKFSDPWEHLVFEDRFTEDEIRRITNEIIVYFVANPPTQERHIFNYLEEFPETHQIVERNPIDRSLLDEFTYHRPHSELKVRDQIIACWGESEYRIHDETEQKVLSAVTYLAPHKDAHGTFIYDGNKELVKEVEWKVGRTLVFCGQTDKTWHSYKGTKLRFTLNTFLER